MSFNATFYVFGKRRNSTALPTNGTTSAVVPILLKDECDAKNPILEIDSQDPDNYFAYNYCYLPFFSRYYFVKNRTVDTGRRLFIYLEEDYLGSFKSAIQLSNGFIKYSSSATNLLLADGRIPSNAGYTKTVASARSPLNFGSKSYFVAVVGESKTCVYNISKSDLRQLFRDSSWVSHSMSAGSDDKATITNFGNMLGSLLDDYTSQGTLFNYLRSCYVIPLSVNEECLGSSTSIIAGHFNTGISGQELVDPVYSSAVSVSIPWSNANWMRCAPYTEVILYLPFFGVIPIDTNSVINSAYLTIKYSISYSDGGLSYSVETEDNRIIATGSTNIRSEYGLGSSNVGNLGGYAANLAGNFLTGLANMEKSGSIGADIFSDLSNAATTATGLIDTTAKGFSTAGGLGGQSATGLELEIKCYCISKSLSDSQSNFAIYFGYPLFKTDSFAAYTGFLQTEGFKFDYSGATQNEKDIISNMLNSGIYIE